MNKITNNPLENDKSFSFSTRNSGLPNAVQTIVSPLNAMFNAALRFAV